MSSDSQFGGTGAGGGPVPVNLSDAAIALLDKFLFDTVGGTTTTGTLDGSPTTQGIGSDGELQGGILPGLGTVEGTLSNGVLQLDLSLPAEVGLIFQGLDEVSVDQWVTFLKGVVTDYGVTEGQQSSLFGAIDQIAQSMMDAGVTSIVLRVFSSVTGGTEGASAPLAGGLGDMVIDASATPDVTVFGVELGGLSWVLKGVENAVIANAGSVTIEGSTAVHLVADTASQSLVGGSGNDTLVGGGGNDTLTGGLGDDVFGFSALGHVTITDFDVAHDSLGFSSTGITSIAQLAGLVTGVTQTAEGVTFNFGHDASITLVGVSASEITSDLIKLTF